jgi:hypothetical protein
MNLNDASNFVTEYSFLAGVIGGLLTTYRLRRNWKYRYLRKVWGMRGRDSVVLVCSERNNPEQHQNPDRREYIYLLKYGDVDALVEVSNTLLRLYPDIDLKILSSGEADTVSLDLGSHIVLIGGPDLNRLTRRILEMDQTRFDYRSTYIDKPSSSDPEEITIFDKTDGKEWFSKSLDRDYGYFERIRNPMSANHNIILIGGCHTIGVTAAARMFSLSQAARPDSAAIVLNNAKRVSRRINRGQRFSLLVRTHKIGATISTPVLPDSAVIIDEG